MPDYVPDAAVDLPDHPDPDAAPADPLTVLADWFPGNDDSDRPLMTLGTVDTEGWPDARTVLLSRYDESGLHFHTDSLSRKAAQLRAHPFAVCTVVWPHLLRQVVIQGQVFRNPEHDGAIYSRRPRYLQLLAWVNSAEHAQLPTAERIARWSGFSQDRPEGSLSPPDNWAGYVVQPARVTFWQGRADRASIRVEYRRTDDGWTSARLAG